MLLNLNAVVSSAQKIGRNKRRLEEVFSKRFRFLRSQFIFLAIFSFLFFSVPLHAEDPSFNLLDARERGFSDSESAQGSLMPTFDETSKKDVLELDYSLNKNASARVWVKDFPSALGKDSVNTVKIGVKIPEAGQVNQISIRIELKGTKETQSIPLQLRAGWNSVQETVDWGKIGDLKELAFVVSATGNQDSVQGTLAFAAEFLNQEATAKTAPSQEIPEAKPAVPEKSPAEKQASPAPKPRSSYNLSDAREQGTSNTGTATGTLTPTYDEAVGKDVLELDYSLPKNSTFSVWMKEFPAGLGAEAVNTVKAGLRIFDPGQEKQISISMEVRGTKDVQTIPLRLRSGWNSIQETIDWEKIGELKEAVFVLSPAATVESAEGTVSFALDFVKSAAPSNRVQNQNPPLYSFLDSGEKGVFNIGPSKGLVGSSFDEATGKDVWKFDYSVPPGAVVGVWTKSFPDELGVSSVDAIRIGVNVPNAEQLRQISLKVEVKGDASMQTIPLCLHTGWNSFRELINWNLIGNLKEVVFVVSPTVCESLGDNPMWFSPTEPSAEDEGMEDEEVDESKCITGTLYFDFDFSKVTILQKHFMPIETGLIILLSLLAAWMAALAGKMFGRKRDGAKIPGGGCADCSCGQPSGFSVLKRDFLYGVAAVMIATVAFHIYSMGALNPLEGGFSLGFLAAGLAGALIAELLKFGLTGKHLTAGEVFQDVFLTGLLAVSSSRHVLLQAPANWSQLLMISNLTATIAFLTYHISNMSSLASAGRHLRSITGTLIVGTPYLFGWLLTSENAGFLQEFANNVTFGLLVAWPVVLKIMGRLLVVFIFNEILTNGINMAIKGKILKTSKSHLYIFWVSLGVVVSPLIADLGSSMMVAPLPVVLRALISILTTGLSFGGLWAEVYLITGLLLDGGHKVAPSDGSISKHVTVGMRKGMAYSGILVAILYALNMLLAAPLSQTVMASAPLAVGMIAGALIFPFLKTIIETFDGSLPFFERARYSYRFAALYARGAVVGFGFAYMVVNGLFQKEMPDRIAFGLLIGLIASSGISLLRDIVYAVKGQGKIQSWRLYLVDGVLGAFVGAATAFYLDSRQVPVVIEKFKLYTSAGLSSVDYITYPLLNKWGRIDIGDYTGGSKLLFIESLAGVINWSIAAWLFAINKVFMQAFFDKDKTPIKFFFSKAGFAQLIEHMIYVLRWGLWMSPIIFTFLRMMPEPTWYNQDGAIRTLIAVYKNMTLSPTMFQMWSLQVFVYIMAFDFFRILIWMDHMGLRVATLVNLSFLGMDKLDEKVAKFIGPAAAQRYIPEGVKRFTTWGPLLIPFYLPRGRAWDYAWSTSESMQNAARGTGLIPTLQSLSMPQALLLLAGAVVACTGLSFVIRALHRRALARRVREHVLSNEEYKVVLKESGEIYSEVIHEESDISRRSYDPMEPCGRILYLMDAAQKPGASARSWPVVGNFPAEEFEASRIVRDGNSLKIINASNGVRATITVSLPDKTSPAEIWSVNLENLTAKSRELKIIPYLEWVLNGGIHDRFHTQYTRLYPEMEYVSEANAILAYKKSSKSVGILASDISPEGFLSSRVDFIGRARSIWSPRIFETMNFPEARDTAAYPTFDPIGSLLVNVTLDAKASKTVRLMIGYSKNKEKALELIRRILSPKADKVSPETKVKKEPLIGHGEIPPGTPLPYAEYSEDGNKLIVHTPYTPRPFDHAMSNTLHSVMVTNRGLHTSCNGNSQQNRVTPDWPDTVTKEIPVEALYLFDPDRNEWFSPTYHPLNDASAKNNCEFSVDGTAVFHMTKGTLSTELTVFVPPEDPTGIYLLTVKNRSDQPRKMRIAPYFQIALAFMPERSGPLQMRHDKVLDALYFQNPRNIFRTGWAFASMSIPADCVETNRGRFFGKGRSVRHPYLVEKGGPDFSHLTEEGQIAGFLGTVEIPAQGERTVAVILGQTDGRKHASQIVQKYKNIETVKKSLDETRKWWLGLMRTVEVKTNSREFNSFQNWLKYQALAERIWARRGFYQTSGAFGFRDQLQDTINLIWVDPALARNQIRLHASQQFVEGDVFHWFFTLTDGRAAFSCRSHASDNPLWLPWAVAEYIRMTGDDSILDEMTAYMVSEFPFAPLPKNKHGWGHLYHRSMRADSVYRHCLKSIDLVLRKRSGKHGLPLMGTGDWNDGLDEIGALGKGESVWVGLFLCYILQGMLPVIEKKEGLRRREHYAKKLEALKSAIEKTWRGDRYLRAIHDDGTEIGMKGSGIWEIDALMAAWAVMSGINFEREVTVFNTALSVLEKDDTILLGWPALREGTKPYLGRSSKYPEGVRENGMYCHGVQWLVRAARILAEKFEEKGNSAKAEEYRAIAYRLWLKISPIEHTTTEKIEIYGGQPNKQAADLLTTFDRGRMIWSGYTGAAGWMLRQAIEGVAGASLICNKLTLPQDLDKPRGGLKIVRIQRDIGKSPLRRHPVFQGSPAKCSCGDSVSKKKVKIVPPEATADIR